MSLLRPHLFEFCDQSWVPASVRQCLFEFMGLCLEGFRPYYRQVAQAALKIASDRGLDTIVELGAGSAPITRHLAQDPQTRGMTLVPCDLFVDEDAFRRLAERYPGQVQPIYTPVDMTQPPRVDGRTLFVISGSWHHVPRAQRAAALGTLTRSADCVAVFEALRLTAGSLLLTLTGVLATFLLPLARWRQPGRLRRILWCWLVPVVAAISLWDGIVSCLRQWTEQEWQQALTPLVGTGGYQICSQPHWLEVVWTGSASGQPLAEPAGALSR